jgi:polar amino acid transport system substrate-binding protein
MRQLRAFCLLLVTLAFLLPVFSVTAQDSEFKPDLGGRTITVAVENAYPPFNYRDEATGEAVGWDYDTVNEICARINCVPEYVETSWEGMIVAVSNGEFDMAADGITIASDRKKLVDFSMGYANIIQRLMVKVDESRFANVEEFIAGDYTVGVQLGTTNFLTAQELVGDARIVGLSDFGSAIQALIAGDVDAVIIDDVAGQGYVGENSDQIKLFDDILKSDEQLGYIFPQGSDLVPAFNWGLMSIAVDGTLNAINEKNGLGPFVDLGQ